MNPLGVHALVWVPDWSPGSARRAISATSQAGFDLVEIPLLDLAMVDSAGTRTLLQDHGLGAATSLGLTAETDVSSDDPATARRGRDVLARALEISAEIGATSMCGVLYSALGKYSQPCSERGRRHSQEAMAWLAAQAADAGVALSLEVVNRYETNLANTAAEMAAFVDGTGADIGLHLDTYHMNIEETDFASPVTAFADRLSYVHVGESHRGYLGDGTVDFSTFFATLTAVGYTGPITFESFSSAVVHRTLSNTLAVWRDLWTDSEDLARAAITFIRDGLSAARTGASA